jgi:hypothetical protein
MNRDAIEEKLQEIDRFYRGENETADQQIREMRRMLEVPDGVLRRNVREYFLDLVNLEGGPWGLALEALLADGHPDSMAGLEALARKGRRNREWQSYVLGALARGRYQPAMDLYVASAEAAVQHNDAWGLGLLQHLYALDQERALELSSRYFANQLPRHMDDIRGMVQMQLMATAERGEALVAELVRRTSSKSPGAGASLTELFLEELEMDWMKRLLGVEKINRISECLAG